MEGKVFTTTWGETSYEISVMIDRDAWKYELRLNGGLLKKGMLNWFKYYYFFSVERDGHRFFVIIHKTKGEDITGAIGTVYEFECFADGVMVSDGKTTFDTYYHHIKAIQTPPMTAKQALCLVGKYVATWVFLLAVAVFVLHYDISENVFDWLLLAIASFLVGVVIPRVYKSIELHSLRKFAERLDEVYTPKK